MPVALGDPLVRLVQLDVVLGEVEAEVRRLVRQQRAAVLAEVEGVEVVAEPGPELGQVALEEVVAEAVHVQHGTLAAVRGGGVDERGDDAALAVVGELEHLRDEGLPEDVGHALAHAAGVCPRSLPGVEPGDDVLDVRLGDGEVDDVVGRDQPGDDAGGAGTGRRAPATAGGRRRG